MDSSTTPMGDDAWTPNGNGDGNGAPAGLMDKAREQIQPVVSQAQQKAGEVMGQATDQVKTRLTEQKDRATEGLESVVQVLRHTGQTLHIQHFDTAGQYAETAADQVERLRSFLQEKEVDEIVDQVQGFARSQPALILGATFALGFLAARLIKNAETGSPSGQDYSSGNYTSGYPDTDLAATGYSDEGRPDISVSDSVPGTASGSAY